MIITLQNPEKVKINDRVSFLYNGKLRLGTIEHVNNEFMTIKHKNSKAYGGKLYSSYRFDRLDSFVNVHISRHQASQFL